MVSQPTPFPCPKVGRGEFKGHNLLPAAAVGPMSTFIIECLHGFYSFQDNKHIPFAVNYF